ncbi:MAG: hypothetical protein FJ220_04565 [Kiritimatiellaceae bacterium]|nr:hypothetical protein [Kiritimatiellaceae bacterium]
MIDLCASRNRMARDLWAGHVQQLFHALALEDSWLAQEVAQSVAVFCQQQPYVPRHILSVLLARSFYVLGDEETAIRLLKHDAVHRVNFEAWLDILSVDVPFSTLYPFLSSRVLHPQHLTSVGTLWIVDLNAIRVTDADRHELIVFQTIRTLIEQISVVWKKSGGRGTLGIKGLYRWVPDPHDRKGINPYSTHIRDVLSQRAITNGWKYRPDVIFLGSQNRVPTA